MRQKVDYLLAMFPTQLCHACSALTIEATLQEIDEALKAPPLSEADPHEHDQTDEEESESQSAEISRPQAWHADLGTVHSSSESCSLCKLVLQGLREARAQLVEDTRLLGDWYEEPKDLYDDISTISWYLTGKISLDTVAWPLNDFEKNNAMISVKSHEELRRLHAIIRVAYTATEGRSSWGGYGDITTELRVSSKDGQISDLVDIDHIVEPDPTSSHVFDKLRFWLSTCANNHKICKQQLENNVALPSRVLNVGNIVSNLVHLEETSRLQSTPYVALSHCWGLSQAFTTTTESLESRKKGIRVDELPQTFQDAITMTRGLGLQYIWIDSLCIIQDNMQDWQRESAKMAAIYRGANIVIGASTASADSEGFLHRRDTESASLRQLNIKLLPPNPQRLSATSDPVKAEPLGGRAWTLQERYLPHRMLSCGKDQMYWECSEMVASEDGDCVPRTGDRLGLVAKTAAIDLSISGISGRSPGETTDINYFDWYETVKEYAKRSITKSPDRLPALGGLAKALSEVTKDKYLVGMWQKGFIEGLLWCKAEGVTTLTEPTVEGVPKYRAPSWSWASLDGFINFPAYNFYDRCKWKAMMANFEPLATYVDSSLTPSGEDTFGGIKEGWIKVRGPLLPIKSVRNWDEVSYTPPGIAMDPSRSSACDKVLETKIHHKGKSEAIFFDGGFDLEQRNRIQGNLLILLLARLPDPFAEGRYMDIRFGLILEKMESQDKYRRVGIIDGVVKTHTSKIRAILGGKVHLANRLWKQHELEGDEDIPNLQGPDPFDGLEQTEVTII